MRPFLARRNAPEPRRRASFCPVSRPRRNRPFHAAYHLEQTLVLCVQIGGQANCHCRVMTSRSLRSSRLQFAASVWPGCGFLLSFVLTQGCSMGRPDRILSWWDQEVDRKGRQIRGDVRSAAHEVWKEACRRTQALLADRALAADLMEDSVAQVSRYLDRIGAPPSSRKNGLLLLAFSRALRRLAAKSRRLEPAGGAAELSSRVVDYAWSRQVDARLDLEKIVRKLSERNTTVLALRGAGYNWEEVAQLVGTSVGTVRNSFWREIREVKRKLHIDGRQRHRIDHCVSQGDSRPAYPEEA
jgi:DNA-directed RNA polymerase specialized sigma24 family protein